ncbi:MAG TPA: amino acid racemase [Pyrinomonadaceae bacterium]|nr:amino acid racemase [Pyrinomonadaceae bacterium]
MKTVGIIGGVGPESTIEYYRSIIASYRRLKPDGSYPPVIINSVNLTKLIDCFSSGRLEEAAQYLTGEVQRLAGAGADFAVVAANTPHIVFDEVQRDSPVPLLSIVRATCEEAARLGMKRLGLFATRFTMRAGFYQRTFADAGLSLVLPREDEQEYVHDKYMNELLKDLFLPETRGRLLSIARRMRDEEGVEGLILGGTELPLILRDADAEEAGVPFLDTTQIHVRAIVAEMLS